MTISFVGSAVPAGNPTTSFTIAIPAVQPGDLLVLACTNRDATAAPVVTDNDIGGYTWVRKSTEVSKGSLWYRRATDVTSAKTITANGFTGSASGVLVAARGAARSGDPFNAYSLEENIAGNEAHAGLITDIDGCAVVLSVHNVANDNPVTASAASILGSLAQGAESLSTGGLDCATSLRGAIQSAAGDTGAFSWAQVDGITTSIAFAIKPESASTVSVALDHVCAGQGHIHFDVSVNGGAPRSMMLHVDEMLAALTEDEREIIFRGLLRIHGIGKTRAQMRSDILAGITMTV